MTKFIKTKLKKSDDQTNIDKYREAANITEYHILSKFYFLETLFQNSRWSGTESGIIIPSF